MGILGFARLVGMVLCFVSLSASSLTERVNECALYIQYLELTELRNGLDFGRSEKKFSEQARWALDLEIYEIETKLEALAHSAPKEIPKLRLRRAEKYAGDFVRYSSPHREFPGPPAAFSQIRLGPTPAVGAFLALRYANEKSQRVGASDRFLVWTEQEGKHFHPIWAGTEDGFRTIAIEPAGERVAAGMESGVLSIYSLKTLNRVSVLGQPGAPVTHIAYTSDGAGLLVARSENGILHFYDIATGEEKNRYVWAGATTDLGPLTQVSSIAISRDQSRVAAASREGNVKVWDTETGQLVAVGVMEGPDQKGNTQLEKISFTPDGLELVGVGKLRAPGMITSKGEVWVFDHRRGRVANSYSLPGFSDPKDFTFSESGSRLRVVGAHEVDDRVSGRLVEVQYANGRRTRDLVFKGRAVSISATARFLALEGDGLSPNMAVMFLPPFD